MPYRKQDDADEGETDGSALWPSAADGSSGLRDRRDAAWSAERLGPDRKLGPYQLLTPIGTTAYGRAFRAHYAAQARDVALHFLSGAAGGEAALARDLPLAVAKCAQLSHANVIAVEEHGQRDDGTYYVVTEPLAGQSLADCLDDVRTLPLSRALSIVVQVGRALRAAHKLGIVHGALTPANVRLVMTEQGELARVVGFGAEQFRDPGAMSTAGAEPDVRGDVLAVGDLLFRMLAGKPPPVVDGVPAALSVWSAEPVPRALDELVARCLEPRPEARLADLVALTRELRHIARRVDAGLRHESEVLFSPDESTPVYEPSPLLSERDANQRARSNTRSGAESVRLSSVGWILLGLLVALATVWLIWHASGCAPDATRPMLSAPPQ